MKPYGNQVNLKKKVPYQGKKSSENISKLNIKLIHQIFDTINISLLVLICTLFFLSFDSQKKWSNTYKNLSITRSINSNLIDYISKTEEFYIKELESLNTYRKTKPEDLIYLDKITEKKESFFKKNFRSFIKGFNDSKYQRGY
jgi:formyltetrahydrofolate synthetase